MADSALIQIQSPLFFRLEVYQAQATLTRHQRAPVVQQTHLLLVRLLQLALGPLIVSRRAIAVTPFRRCMKLLRIGSSPKIILMKIALL